MKRKQIIFFAISLLATLFIFLNSLKTAELSTKDSSVFVNMVKSAAEFLGVKEMSQSDIGFITVIVRKAAHITEFAVQTVFVSLFIRSLGYNLWEKASAALLCGLLTACADETLQLFSDGRGSLVTDVLIDFIGVILGLCAAFALLYFLRGAGNRR